LAGLPNLLGDGSDVLSKDSANESVEGPLIQVIRRAVEQLPTRQREVLERFSAGETSANIAKALNIMPTTVRSLKRFALAVIEAKVLEYEDRSEIE
jgi:DNA-binding NarL/FixJ family response regulator